MLNTAKLSKTKEKVNKKVLNKDRKMFWRAIKKRKGYFLLWKIAQDVKKHMTMVKEQI